VAEMPLVSNLSGGFLKFGFVFFSVMIFA